MFANGALEIDGEKVVLEQVDTFPVIAEKNTIYLKLTTIQKMHMELNSPRENSITYEDLERLNLILLGDEAHHYNAETKAKGKSKTSKEVQEAAWEGTVDKVLGLTPKNRLFEFTATINLSHKGILNKYKDKIIYLYDLKQFMRDGFSKNVTLIQANDGDEHKMLDAVLLSQYRKMIATDHGMQSFKPVMMLKSNTIKTSKEKEEAFIELMAGLTPEQLQVYLSDKQKRLASTTSIWHQVITYYMGQDLVSIVKNIQTDFDRINLLNVNQSDLLEEHPILLNTLEEADNPIRAIFAVAKLNEGWDVLNLYDIVRMSENAVKTKVGTDSEAQLIGRGARHHPFVVNSEKSYTRRYDNTTSPLAILETLHYHTINEPTYIKHLNQSLDEANVIASVDGGGVVHQVKLKAGFKDSNVYKYGKLYRNKVEDVTGNYTSLKAYSIDKVLDVEYLGDTVERRFGDIEIKPVIQQENERQIEILQVDQRYFMKAAQRNSFYSFDHLKNYFPLLKSMNEFISSHDYLKGADIRVSLPSQLRIEDLAVKEKLYIIEKILARIADNVRKNYRKEKGTKDFISTPLKELIKDYNVFVPQKTSAQQHIHARETKGKTWYVYDVAVLNTLEHELVDLMGNFINKLRTKYEEVYLIRNDEKTTQFKLTEFDGVRGFMPDFILYMKDESFYYQVLVEPKGEHLVPHDQWKEDMLEAICKNDVVIIDENESIKLLGLKFYNDTTKNSFISDLEKKIFDGQTLFETHSLL